MDFTGRADELASLHAWRHGGPRLGVRWLYGPGGQGKSRLAGRLARDAEADGWQVITAAYGAGSVIASGAEDLRLDRTAGLLLIVDYADRWPLSHLALLLDNSLLFHVAVSTRVLLLGRSADPWPAIRQSLKAHQAGGSVQPLLPIPHGSPDRAEMFDAARRGFARRYGLSASDQLPVPAAIDRVEFGLPLTLHMFALVSVDAAVSGRRVPETMSDLTVYLLDRESRHWAVLYEEQPTGSAGRAYRTEPETMRRVVFTAALTGSVPQTVGASVLSGFAASGDVPQLLQAHRWCYPPVAADGDMVLTPLYPDRLAEDFIALTTPGHDIVYPAYT
ncbi:ATP-binding protein [Micromonospora sp. NPDC051006]|uniref:ATP-binding protein n=1 Tax=Micromonospora sp. NPDC051006 TaxID=3364283 RepID=UPI00378CC636